MEAERGKPETARRLETRLLHFQQFGGSQEIGDQYWRGYTYVWNDEQTDADLLDASGKDVLLKVQVDGKRTEQKYRFPSRAECTLCHTNASKFALGVSTLQMNGTHDYGGVVANQLATLDHIGIFAKPLPAAPEKLPKLADFRDRSLSAEVRARSYLHSNCSHCHMKWGGGNAEFKLLATIPLADMGIVGVPPQHGAFDIKDAKILAPGDPDRSVLVRRMAMTGLGRMPHIGSQVVDEDAVDFIRQWIREMGKDRDAEEPNLPIPSVPRAAKSWKVQIGKLETCRQVPAMRRIGRVETRVPVRDWVAPVSEVRQSSFP